jgi:CheY-like chemotaxis protein
VSNSPQPPRPRLLLVDDEPSIRAIYPEVLRGEYEVIVAANGREALAVLARSTDFDVILCDLTMPGMDGLQFYDALRVQAPQLLPRVLFCTGGFVSVRLREFSKSIPNPFLNKPITVEVLCAALERVVHTS